MLLGLCVQCFLRIARDLRKQICNKANVVKGVHHTFYEDWTMPLVVLKSVIKKNKKLKNKK